MRSIARNCVLGTLWSALFSIGLIGIAAAQVSPNEVLDPALRALETQYFSQLKTVHQAVARVHFPFPFSLSRYVGLEPAQQVEADTRGLEFVHFKDRVVLKATGNYNAAYSTSQFSRNERASRTFRDVFLPILQAETQVIPQDIECDALGLEVAYHVRENQKSYDYEGKEILVVVLDRADAFLMAQAGSDTERQKIWDRSLIYVNGEDYGLSLLDKDPVPVDKVAPSKSKKLDATSTASSATPVNKLTRSQPNLLPSGAGSPNPSTGGEAHAEVPGKMDLSNTKPAAKPEDAERLQTQYKSALAAFAQEGQARFQFVNYDPPAFVVVSKQLALQMTLRNPQKFDPEKTSIYKRAAQTFDLFLAPKMADILTKAPDDDAMDLFDFSVVNALASTGKEHSEAIEFLLPKIAARQFAASEITNQQLIDKSVVLVNGVRIALNLQLVE